jgi:hypothetical protein
MPAFTAESGMIAGGGPDGTMARRRMPPLVVETAAGADADVVAAAGAIAAAGAGAARDSPASNDKMSAVRREKPARRTKP